MDNLECNMPLLHALLDGTQRGHISFHVPGHKGGRALPPGAELFQELLAIDMTEITGLDDLHHPEGAIREAQQLAAACFGADETCFLVNGSTVGNLAAILSVCSAGDMLIVQRNVHKSVVNGLMLAGARAVFIAPRTDESTGLAGGIGVAELEQALQRYPEAKGVWITNPNYYGMGGDLRILAETAHRCGMPLLVDEAHGAHYGFHSALPESALAAGADLVVQSTHKMLTAMTMGAMLHMQGSRIDRQRVKQCLAMLQSSSPSYPIMASLDASRHLLQTEGRERLDMGMQAVRHAENALREWPWFRLVANGPATAYETKDPFKMTISDATETLNGFMLRDALERQGIMTEMADPRHVLLVFSLASERTDADRLVSALGSITDQYGLRDRVMKGPERIKAAGIREQTISEPVSFGMDSFRSASEVLLSDAVGRLAAEMVVPYPPGIPALYAGERIEEETVRYLQSLADMGARFQGGFDNSLRTIRVFA
ncbi:aminotransferase class I/II-fold pyridoxal phosphate-dependent enzyme [Paenibacillus hodogayensis]|uniref:Aminotransferase class I/II-fold pyridoxal phosphate-dependent enzyme n=1 Tax=Paenibacillus hodogayensis TaxID=279208 RepID=A0ABV5W5L5_9BACL